MSLALAIGLATSAAGRDFAAAAMVGTLNAASATAQGPASTVPDPRRHERAKRVYGWLAGLAGAMLALIAAGLVIWTIRWGHWLRRKRPPAGPESRTARLDPWVVGGQRLKAPEPADESEEQP